MLAEHGFQSVAAPGFEAPGVVVCYTDDEAIVSKFVAAGVQVAAGVPLMCDEGENFRAFRIGLFGLDKLHHPERTLDGLTTALAKVKDADS